MPNTATASKIQPPKSGFAIEPYLLPMITLGVAYGLLFLTIVSANVSQNEIMQRCVLANPKMSRIWSVGNIEIGLAYLGVFGAMLFYFLKIYRNSVTHLRDLTYALSYLLGSFILDYICVELFEPFFAMLLGDAVIMTFTVIVSRQIWFQRLLGVFVPMIFLTCGIGHFLEGVSYWKQTYHLVVPWTMVTADIGFAVLVNASRYPAFIRGEDILTELHQEKARAEELSREVTARKLAEAENLRLLQELQKTSQQQKKFLRDVLASVTEGHLIFCESVADLPPRPAEPLFQVELTSATLRDLRHATVERMRDYGFSDIQQADAQTAIGEAAMNAVRHGGGGLGSVYVIGNLDRPVVQVWIEDGGKGIDIESLPRATLELGYSSAGTLGHGFYLMLRTADRLWLKTSPEGTVVVIEKSKAVLVEDTDNGLYRNTIIM